MAAFKPLQMVDAVDVIVDWSGGNVLCRQVDKVDPKDAATVDEFIPVGPDGRPQGFMRKPGAQTVELTVRPAKKEEVPWRTLHASKEIFVLTLQYYSNKQKGERLQGHVVVKEMAPSSMDNEGKGDYTVTLLVMGEVANIAAA